MVLYLLFKAISTGAMLAAALLWWMGFDGPLVTLAAPALSLVFISMTAIVLIVDLERPERFYYLLTRSNWRSWMVWGAWFLTAHGALSALWLGAGWLGWQPAVDALVIPVVIVAVLATSYTGFLFAQGLARDLWQGPSAAIDLVAQSLAAGCASLLLTAVMMGGRAVDAVPVLGTVLAGSLIAHLVILVFEHLLAPSPTRHHEMAVDTIRRGAFAPLFWGGAVIGGGLLPLAVLLTMGTSASALLTSLVAMLALAGGAAWEYIWVEAGQSVPLS
jgi:formate-dependent nitrite reductase membrane component NrfD